MDCDHQEQQANHPDRESNMFLSHVVKDWSVHMNHIHSEAIEKIHQPHLAIVPLPRETKASPCRPSGLIGDRSDVPLLTIENDPQSGATRLNAFGPSLNTQVIANLGSRASGVKMAYE